jgi:leucine-rich repeat protein SHOC2
VQRAQPGANRDVRSKAPSKRREMSTSSQMGHVQRTLRTVSVQCDLSAPDADLDAEPEELMCPITRAVFRDPVMVVDSGHTYEKSAILSHFKCNGARDPLTNCALSSTKVMTNWVVRQIVQAWLGKHLDVTPDGWDSRELLEPSKDDGTRTFDDEGDVGVLRTWRAMCPELQERWPEAARPEDWEGVEMENGRVVELVLGSGLEEFGLTGAVPAEVGRLSALRVLSLADNELTSLPAEIGQLTALERLYIGGNQLTSLPAEIGQLTALERLYIGGNQLTSVPAEIGQLTSLTWLDLGGNQLTSVPVEIVQLTSLTVLGLDSNRLTIVPAEIGQLTSLKELRLYSNKLTSLPAEIGQLTSLEALYLDNNQLTSVPPEIGQLTSLRELYLRRNRLTSVPAEIGQLTSLNWLNLSGNQLTSLPAEIGRLTSLKALWLDNNLVAVKLRYGCDMTLVAIRELRAAGCEVRSA